VTGVKGDNPFEESFNFVLPGYNVRPLEIEAAIGIEQLRKLPEFIRHRRKNAELFYKLFHADERFIIQKEIGKSSWFGFSLVVNPESQLSRGDVIDTLSSSRIECRPIVTGNFTKNTVVRFFNHSIHSKLLNAELIDTNGFFVGNHQYDIASYLHYLKKVLA
jgi:CDP-6-deoxy-D-xylo-4-hexulose-3-dehydrase